MRLAWRQSLLRLTLLYLLAFALGWWSGYLPWVLLAVTAGVAARGYWRLLRYFTLGEASGARVGFLAQSPLGDRCAAVFDSVSYRTGAPADLRDGT